MVILLRYACLLGLGLASIFVFFSAANVTGRLLIAENGHTVQHPEYMGLGVLAAIGVLGMLSVLKFVFTGLPVMVRDRYRDARNRLGTLLLVCVVCAAFVVL